MQLKHTRFEWGKSECVLVVFSTRFEWGRSECVLVVFSTRFECIFTLKILVSFANLQHLAARTLLFETPPT
jgi:hypothetical protein